MLKFPVLSLRSFGHLSGGLRGMGPLYRPALRLCPSTGACGPGAVEVLASLIRCLCVNNT